MLPFSQPYLFGTSKGFKKQNVSQVIVTNATSVKKCFLLSTNFMHLNKKCWFLGAIRISLLARSNDNSHSVFLLVVLLNLMIFWVRENGFFLFFEDRNLLTLKLNYSAINCLQKILCLTLAGTALVAFTYIAFLHDVTAFILVFQNNETEAMLVFQTSPVGVELFSYVNAFFCSNKFAYMLVTWVNSKRSIGILVSLVSSAGQINGTKWFRYLKNVVVFITINDCNQYN